MQDIVHRSRQFISADSPDQRFAFLLSGGTEEVKAAAERHAGWEGKALLPLYAVSIAWVAAKYGSVAGLPGVLAVALAGLLAVGIGMALFSLAQGSRRQQVKAGNAIDAAIATIRFETRGLLVAFRFAIQHFSYRLALSRTAILAALERHLVGLSGLVHVGLAAKLLPTPFRAR